MECNVVVLSTDSNMCYINATYFTMWLIMYHSNDVGRYKFYIMTNLWELDIDSRKLLESIGSLYKNASIEFLDMKLTKEKKIIENHITNATYYRLYLAELLDVDRCLYIDQDILIRGNISELFEIDIEDYYFAAVCEPKSKNDPHKAVCIENGFYDFDHYVNAGVLLLNLKKFRTDFYKKQRDDYMEKELWFGDQDVLNFICKEKIRFISRKYNDFRTYILDKYENPLIVHYSGMFKPWNEACLPYEDEWWDYCRRTRVYCDFISGIEWAEKYSLNNHFLYSLDDVLAYTRGKKILIYGAGNVCSKLIRFLEKNRVEIIGVAVTDEKNNKKNIMGYEVKSIFEYKLNKNEVYVLIAYWGVATDFYRNLYRLGYKNVNKIYSLNWFDEYE